MLTLTIEPGDTAQAKRKDGLWNPIAQALRRATGRWWFVEGTWACRLPDGAHKSDTALAHALGRRREEIPLPAEATSWLNVWDRGIDHMPPLTLTLSRESHHAEDCYAA